MRSCQASSKKASKVRESPLQKTPYEEGATAGLEALRAKEEGSAAGAMEPLSPSAQRLESKATAASADLCATARSREGKAAAELTPARPAAAACSSVALAAMGAPPLPVSFSEWYSEINQ